MITTPTISIINFQKHHRLHRHKDVIHFLVEKFQLQKIDTPQYKRGQALLDVKSWGTPLIEEYDHDGTFELVHCTYPLLIRILDVIFLDKTKFEALSKEDQNKIKNHIIIYEELPLSNMSAVHINLNIYCMVTLSAIADTSFQNMQVIDAGSGDGSLALAAWKQGAKRLILIDHDIGQIQRAQRNLELNGLRENKDFWMLHYDIKNTSKLITKLRAILNKNLGTAIISNIGPDYQPYTVTNDTLLSLIDQIPYVSQLIIGGHWLRCRSDSTIIWDTEKTTLLKKEQEIAHKHHFTIKPSYTCQTSTAGAEHIKTACITWRASRKQSRRGRLQRLFKF